MDDKQIRQVSSAMYAVATSEDTPEGVRTWLLGLVQALGDASAPDPRLVKGSPLPAALGALADEYADVRQARLDKDKESAAIKERESEIRALIMSTLAESSDTGASGQHHRVQRVTKTVNNVADWATFYGFIQQTGSFEMLQRRLSDKAVTDFADANGGLPPGISTTEVAEISVTKI